MTSSPAISRRVLAKGALLGAAAGLLPATAAHARPPLRLPAPTGPHPVGVRTVQLTDRSRVDPWEPALGAREVVLTVVHPARTDRGYPRAPQLTPAAARVFAELAPLAHPGLPAAGAVDWGGVLTHGHTGAPVLPGRRPVLLYTPGGGDSRTLGTVLAEDLASHGAIVVLVDHPGDATQVELPAGGMRVTVLRGEPDEATFRTMIDTRVADLRFVVDRLGGLFCAAAMDLGRVGIYGHSAGGTAAVYAAHGDHRLRAAVNLEGYLDLGPLDGFDRPLLLVRTEDFDGAARVERSWAGLAAPRLMLAGSAHWAVTDYAALVPRLQAAGLVSAATRDALVGPGDPAVAVAVLRRRLRGFFGRHLVRTGAQ
ncbi:acetylhydrolase [Streptomyces sp. NPDC085481]|uniref:acetylhydrolase n=1 Tax=Streptomyces sp. NPDC085481 TaxID=3365727 RepID=UPI0037CD3BCA